MTTPSKISQLVHKTKTEILEAIEELRNQDDHGNADALVLEVERCGDDHLELLMVREEAVTMAWG